MSKENKKDTDKCNLHFVVAMLADKNVNDLAYKYLDSEATDGVTTKAEAMMYVQGFMQACKMVKNKLKAN